MTGVEGRAMTATAEALSPPAEEPMIDPCPELDEEADRMVFAVAGCGNVPAGHPAGRSRQYEDLESGEPPYWATWVIY